MHPLEPPARLPTSTRAAIRTGRRASQSRRCRTAMTPLTRRAATTRSTGSPWRRDVQRPSPDDWQGSVRVHPRQPVIGRLLQPGAFYCVGLSVTTRCCGSLEGRWSNSRQAPDEQEDLGGSRRNSICAPPVPSGNAGPVPCTGAAPGATSRPDPWSPVPDPRPPLQRLRGPVRCRQDSGVAGRLTPPFALPSRTSTRLSGLRQISSAPTAAMTVAAPSESARPPASAAASSEQT